MNIIVDTNIVFSTLLNPKSTVGEILLNIQDELAFFGPELLKAELERYAYKIAKYSKLSLPLLAQIEYTALNSITFVSEELISKQAWKEAYEITKDVDEDDTPFVALAIQLNAKLWTGDKVLANGLQKKGCELIITTTSLKNLLK